MVSHDWIANEYLSPQITIHHPPATIGGEPIRVEEDDSYERRRVHLIAPDRSEVYFELVLYPHLLDIDRVIMGQREFLITRDATKTDVVMSQPIETEVLGRSATQVHVEFTDEGGRFLRLFSFVNFEDAAQPWGLRVIFDPRSDVNGEILGRLAIKP